MTGYQRIVLLRPGALGDALLAFPALAWLRRVWPGTHLTFVARADVLALAAASGLANATRSFDDSAWRGLWADGQAGAAALRQALDGANAVVAWLRDGEGTVARGLHAAGVGRVVVAPGQPPPGEKEHVARYLAGTLAPLGLTTLPATLEELAALVPPFATAPENPAAETVWDAFGLDGARAVALHPGSGGAAKCWPAEHFAAVAARLRQAGYAPLVIAGPADTEPVARLLAACARGGEIGTPRDAPWPPLVARDLTVEVLAGVLTRCAGYIGNDSGVSHLAALVGCPTLALFGPTDPVRWAPVGRHAHTLRAPHGAMDEIQVDAVWDGVRRLL